MNWQHPPGPWRITADDCDWSASHDGLGTSAYQVIRDANGTVIALAVAHSAEAMSDVPLPHAPLIKAAPDLLHALRRAVVALAGVMVDQEALVREEYEIVSKAIAKATEGTP